MPLAVIAFLLLATPAAAQLIPDKVYDLKLTGTDIAAIAQVANEMPYKQAKPLIDKLLEQTATPAAAPPVDPKAKPPKK